MPDSINYDSGSILTYFARFDANPQGVQQQLSDITAPGADGVGFRKEARRPEPFEGLTEVYTSSFANAITLRAIYDSLAGKLVTITVQDQAYSNILILNPVVVEPFQPTPRALFVILPDGTTSTGAAVIVRARWTFIYAAAPA
jgi:hypothetical protein